MELYSDLILDLYKNPVNYGELKDYDIRVVGDSQICEGFVTFTIKIEKNKIKNIKFLGKTRAITVAANSLFTEKIKGKNIEEVKTITDEMVKNWLGGIVQARIESALVGKKAVIKAIKMWEKKGKKQLNTKIII